MNKLTFVKKEGRTLRLVSEEEVVSYGGDVDGGRPSEKVRPRSGGQDDQPAMTGISTSSAPKRADIETSGNQEVQI